MSVAMCLVTYIVLATVIGPPVLIRLTRGGCAPGLGVLVWLTAMAGVLGSWIAATAFAAADVMRTGVTGAAMWRACMAVVGDAASGAHGLLVQAGTVVIVALAVVGSGRLSLQLYGALDRAHRQAAEHAQAARIVGRRVPGLDAVVLDSHARAAYCVADPDRTAIVTSGALRVLDGDELDAVLTHERAHLDEHHHVLITLTGSLAAALPWITLFTRGAAEVARLLEMRADDAAVRAHGRQTVLAAFSALTLRPDLPAGALAATGADMITRVQRLTSPPPGWRSMLTAGGRLAATGVFATGPIAMAAAGAVSSGLCSVVGM